MLRSYSKKGRSNDLYFNGAIDDVMIFDRELSSDEIKAMYNRGFSLNWDDNGNMTATDMINGTDTTLQYNWDNKLRSATKGTKSISLRYDPGGNRIWKQSTDGAAETTHKYIVDIVGGLPTTLLEITDTDGTILKTYVYANAQVLCQHDGDHSAPRYFYMHDRLGSVRQIINTSANVVKYYTYEPFGEVLEEDGTLTNNMMFTGQYFDAEIDQYYLRARQYDPHISRFTARDLIFGEFEEPLTLHKYLYCRNDPINKIDWNGRAYVDVNFTWTLGTIRAGAWGMGMGSGNTITAVLGALGGGMLGSAINVTFGAMKDDISSGIYPYIGTGIVLSYGGWSTTGTAAPGPVEPGWYYAITFVSPVIGNHGGVIQWVWKQENWKQKVMTGESFTPDTIEVGYARGNKPSLSITRFRVFDKCFDRSEQLDQAVMLGIALDERAAAGDLGVQERYLLLGGTLMMSDFDFDF